MSGRPASALVRSAFVGGGGHWYTGQSYAGGVYVNLFGTRLARDWPVQVAEDQRIREGEPLITSSEGVPSISFTRFDVAYRLDLECDAGPSDPRCSEFERLREVYDGLALAAEVE